MANEQAKELLHSLLDTLEEQKRDMATLQERLAAVVGKAWSTGDLVGVWVNAQGVVIQTKFHPEAMERAGGPAALARYVTEAAQKAAQAAQKTRDEIMAPLQRRMDGLPQMSEIFPGLPDAKDFVPEPVNPSLAEPDSSDRPVPILGSPGSVADQSQVRDDEAHEYYEEVETRPQRHSLHEPTW